MPTNEAPESSRLAFGLPALDALLGGGLRPGTLTVIAGATGAGKTQLGLQWAAHAANAEGPRGVIVDLTSRGDSQNHQDYAFSRHSWRVSTAPSDASLDPVALWSHAERPLELLQPFAQVARRVTRPDVDTEDWHAWKRDLARVIRGTAAFAYSHFTRGVRRLVLDGIEPVEHAADSIQLELLEYLYDRVIRQEHDWAAREVLREQFLGLKKQVFERAYDHSQIGCVALCTTSDVMLHDLIQRPIGQGNLLATANTVIMLGRVARGDQFARALCVVKHRGSACSDRVTPFEIGPQGVTFETQGQSS